MSKDRIPRSSVAESAEVYLAEQSRVLAVGTNIHNEAIITEVQSPLDLVIDIEPDLQSPGDPPVYAAWNMLPDALREQLGIDDLAERHVGVVTGPSREWAIYHLGVRAGLYMAEVNGMLGAAVHTAPDKVQ